MEVGASDRTCFQADLLQVLVDNRNIILKITNEVLNSWMSWINSKTWPCLSLICHIPECHEWTQKCQTWTILNSTLFLFQAASRWQLGKHNQTSSCNYCGLIMSLTMVKAFTSELCRYIEKSREFVVNSSFSYTVFSPLITKNQ